jgi:hypothetical protein
MLLYAAMRRVMLRRLANNQKKRLLLGSGVMGSGLRRPAPRSRSRVTPFPVCGYCERTGRSRDKAAAFCFAALRVL